MRKRGKVDSNQPDIVKALRAIGCSVAITSALGEGFPDLVVGRHRTNYLLEVKDGNKSPSERALTRDERTFHDGWRGEVRIVESVQDALAAVSRP